MSAADGWGCPFCRIVNGDPDGQILREYHRTVVFEPLDPVVPGHLLVVPKLHRRDAAADSSVTAETFGVAAQEVAGLPACNLITSIGTPATQTVMHLHVHIVPRTEGDGLALPWTALTPPP